MYKTIKAIVFDFQKNPMRTISICIAVILIFFVAIFIKHTVELPPTQKFDSSYIAKLDADFENGIAKLRQLEYDFSVALSKGDDNKASVIRKEMSILRDDLLRLKSKLKY